MVDGRAAAREAGILSPDDGHDNRLQVVLGDVMGKGLAASLIASEVRAVLRGHSRYSDVGGAVNATWLTTRHDLEANSRFSTLWVGRLDPSTGAIEYVDAGHGLAGIVGPRGWRLLSQPFLPLGMPVDETWTQATDVLAEDEQPLVVRRRLRRPGRLLRRRRRQAARDLGPGAELQGDRRQDRHLRRRRGCYRRRHRRRPAARPDDPIDDDPIDTDAIDTDAMTTGP